MLKSLLSDLMQIQLIEDIISTRAKRLTSLENQKTIEITALKRSVLKRFPRREVNSTSSKPQMDITTLSSSSQILVVRNTKTMVSLSVIIKVIQEMVGLIMFWQINIRITGANGKSLRTKTELSSSCSYRPTMVTTNHLKVSTCKLMAWEVIKILEVRTKNGS